MSQVGTTAGAPDLSTLTPRRRERVDRIVKAALQTLNEGTDYDAIQIREVAERAVVSLATVYRYYASKEQLFAAVLLAWQAGLRAATAERPLDPGSAADHLSELARQIIDAFERRPQFFRLLNVLEMVPDPVVHDAITREQQMARESFVALLDAYPVEDAKAIVDAILGVLGTSLRRWSRGDLSIDDVRAQVNTTITIVFASTAIRPRSTAGRRNR